MNKRIDALIALTTTLVWVVACLALLYLVYTVGSELNHDGIRGVVMRLWCGAKGCEQ